MTPFIFTARETGVTAQHENTTAPRGKDDTINWPVIWLLLGAAFVVILNETTMTVALPHLMHDLGVDARTAQWLTTGFMLTMAVVIPITGFAMQRLTTRQVFITAMTLFSTGTLIAGLSPSFEILMVARVVQAGGTAIMMPLLMTTILNLVPMERRGEVMGSVSIAMSVAPALGPAMSGLVLQWLSWRWIFFIVLPIALGMLTAGVLRMTNVTETSKIPLDVLSVILSGFGFGALVYALSQIGGGHGAGGGAAGPSMELAFAVAAVGLGLGLFIWRQVVLQRDDKPLLDLRTFKFRDFSVSLAVMMIAFMSMMGTMLLWPTYLQDVRQIPAALTGFLMLPGGLAMGLLGPVIGRLFDRFGARPLVVPAAASMAVMVFLMSRATSHTPIWMLFAVHIGLMLSLACMFTPTFTSGLNALTPKLYGHGSALLGTLQQVAGAAGAAMLITLMQTRTQSLEGQGQVHQLALQGGISHALTIGSIIGLGAVVLATFLRGKPAAATPQGDPQQEVPVQV